MANGNFTFYVDDMDKIAFDKIMMEWETLEEKQEIINAMKNRSKIMINEGKVNLTKHPFKYSKGSPGVKSGNLMSSFRMKYHKLKTGVEVRSGFKRGRGGGNHAHLIDRGTVDRYTKKGYYRGSVSARSPLAGNLFWTDSVEENGPKGMNELMDVIYRTLDRISTR